MKAAQSGVEGEDPCAALAVIDLPGSPEVGPWDATIACAGDIFPSGEGPLAEPAIADLLRSADLAIGNLECPLTGSAEPAAKAGPCLKAQGARAARLREAGFRLLSLANNHIMDYGARGLRDTVEACAAAGLETVGAGEDEARAATPFRAIINGCRVAVVALAEREFSIAGPDAPGAAELEPITAWNAIRNARNGSDLVLAFVHGGTEMCHFPSPRTVKWYRFLVDAGADAVIAHHPHVIQGYEIHKGAPILYSLGNFHFPGSRADSPTRDGLVARLRISGNRLSRVELHLTRQSGDACAVGQPSSARISSWSAHLGRLNRIIGDGGALEEMWNLYCEEIGRSCVFRLNLATGVVFDGRFRAMLSLLRAGKLEAALGWMALRLRNSMLSGPRRRDWRLLGLCYLECPAHLDKLRGSIIREEKRGGSDPETAERYRSLSKITVPGV